MSKTEALLKLTSAQIEEFISDDGIMIDREKDFYEATLNWVKHDAQTRSIHFSGIFQHIRSIFVSKYYLHTNAEGAREDLVKANRSFIVILLNAMKVFSLMSLDSEEATPHFTPRKFLQRDLQLVINCGGFYQEGFTSSILCCNTLVGIWYQLAPVLTESEDSLHRKR